MLSKRGWHIDSRAREVIPTVNGRRQFYDGYVETGGTRLFLVRSSGWDMVRHVEVDSGG